jgi:hypothetical protein
LVEGAYAPGSRIKLPLNNMNYKYISYNYDGLK